MAQLLKSAMVQLANVSRSFAGTRLAVAPRAVAPRVMSTVAKASMGKRELVSTVKDKSGLTQAQAEAAVNAVLETVVGTVSKGETPGADCRSIAIAAIRCRNCMTFETTAAGCPTLIVEAHARGTACRGCSARANLRRQAVTLAAATPPLAPCRRLPQHRLPSPPARPLQARR